MSLNFTIAPTDGLQAGIGILSTTQLNRIGASAVKETAALIKTEISKDIRGILNMSKRDADANISVRSSGQTGEITIVRTPVPLKAYDPLWSGPVNRWYTFGDPPPVSVQTRVGKGREEIRVGGKGGFINLKIGGNVFTRTAYKHGKFGGPTRRVKRISPTTGKPYWSELPITKVYGPTLLGVLENRPGVLELTMDKAQQKLDERLASKLQFVIDGGKI